MNHDPLLPEPSPIDLPVDDPIVVALRGALAREAADVIAGPAGLTRIRAAIREGDSASAARRPWAGPWGRPMLLVAAAACVTLATAAAVTALRPDPGTAPPAGPSDSRPAPSPAPSVGPTPKLPVYYPALIDGAYVLYREFHAPPVGATGDPQTQLVGRVQQAVSEAMSRRPDDPDYSLVWADGAGARVELSTGLIIVTLNQVAAGGTSAAGSGADAIAIQQLVWTATAAAATPGNTAPAEVLIRAEGPTPERFGGIDLTKPFRRGGQPGAAEPRAPLWIDSLGNGAQVAVGRLPVTGQAVGGPGPLRWRLARDGAEISTGQVGPTTDFGGPLGGGIRGVWSLDLQLPGPGRYTFIIRQAGPAAATVASDSKEFTAR